MENVKFTESLSNPVHMHLDGSWWYYDETWTTEFGPFPSSVLAEENCKLYAKEVLGL